MKEDTEMADKIIAEEITGERHPMNGPYRFKRTKMETKTGGVYVILTSPYPGLYNYVTVEESDDMRKEFSSIFLRRTWKKECGKGTMYYAYMCTDNDTEDMDEIEAKTFRIRLKNSLRAKYEKDRQTSDQTASGVLTSDPTSA